MFHYVYRIENKTTNKFYIGKRSSKVEPIKDLGVRYFSSSSNKEFIKDQKINPDNYEYIIIVECTTSNEALEYEIYLHDYFNVDINSNFINKVKQTVNGFSRSNTVPWNKGITLSEEHKKKLSIAKLGSISPRKGKTHSKETIEKMKHNLAVFNPRTKVACIFDYATNQLIAKNVILKYWAISNNYNVGHLSRTANADRTKPHSSTNLLYHKGIYAQYKEL